MYAAPCRFEPASGLFLSTTAQQLCANCAMQRVRRSTGPFFLVAWLVFTLPVCGPSASAPTGSAITEPINPDERPPSAQHPQAVLRQAQSYNPVRPTHQRYPSCARHWPASSHGTPPHGVTSTPTSPLYQPGETIWFRLWELGSARIENQTRIDQALTIQLLDAKGAALVDKRVRATDGVARGDVHVPVTSPGGQYTLKLAVGQTSISKTITVASYRTPQINKQLQFLRAAYRAGDQVALAIALTRATGQPLRGQNATVIVSLNGLELERIEVTTDLHGQALARFRLPAELGASRGSATVLVDAGGLVESAQKSIPIQSPGLELQLFPEGGELIVGLPGRVYFSARQKNGDPARAAGRVVDDQGREVATLESSHRGMGRFSLTPSAGRNYRVQLTDSLKSEFPVTRDPFRRMRDPDR